MSPGCYIQPRPQGFCLKKMGGAPTHFLREKPWGQGCVIYKVLNRKTLSGETFSLLKNVCYQCLNFVLRVTYCFITSC